MSAVGALVARGILGAADLTLARAWVSDLAGIGYAWPRLSTPQPARSLPKVEVVDERRNDLA